MEGGRYRTTPAGRAHYKPLGDPSRLSAEEADRGSKMQREMTPRDWCLSQLAIQLDYETGATVEEMRGLFSNFNEDGYSDMEALFSELVHLGFISALASSRPSSDPARILSQGPA